MVKPMDDIEAESSNRVTVEEVRKLALPLGTRVAAGDGLLNRPVVWTTVVFPDDGSMATKLVQPGELVLVAPSEHSEMPTKNDVDIIRWAADVRAAAVVLSDVPSPAAIAEAKAYGIPVLILPAGTRIRLVEKAIVSLLVDRGPDRAARHADLPGVNPDFARNEGWPN
jgi:hypothetical protein